MAEESYIHDNKAFHDNMHNWPTLLDYYYFNVYTWRQLK